MIRPAPCGANIVPKASHRRIGAFGAHGVGGGLQRLFTAFPNGWPGAGLFLLRAAVGCTVIVQGGTLLGGQDSAAATTGSWIVGLLALVSGALLLIGFLTPLAGAMVAVGSAAHALSWLPVADLPSLDGTLATFLVTIVAAAVVLLGPGAWSIDAWLFGRRQIVIPHEPRDSESS